MARQPLAAPAGDPLELREFLEYLRRERQYSENTAVAYREDIRDFLRFLGNSDIEYNLVTVPILRTYMLDLTVRGYRKSSIKRSMSGLTQYYDWLTGRGYAKSNPFRLVSKPKADQRLPDFLSFSEMDQLLYLNGQRTDELAVRDQAILELLFASGLRVSELCSLTLQNLNLKARAVRVFGKGKKERLVPFTLECQRCLDAYLRELRPVLLYRNKTGEKPSAFFLNNSGRALTPRGVQYILGAIEKKIGAYYKLHPHKLRHTFATTLLNKGADFRTIQELMGHTSIGTTQIYTHVSYANMKQTYDQVFPRAKRKPGSDDE